MKNEEDHQWKDWAPERQEGKKIQQNSMRGERVRDQTQKAPAEKKKQEEQEIEGSRRQSEKGKRKSREGRGEGEMEGSRKILKNKEPDDIETGTRRTSS